MHIPSVKIPAPDANPLRDPEPAKRWINWGRITIPGGASFYCPECGASIRHSFGQVFPSHCKVFPSKDTAETSAAEVMAQDIRRFGSLAYAYLGAFPEGKRP